MHERVIVPDSLLECAARAGLAVFAERDPQWDFISRQFRRPIVRWFATTGHWSDCLGNTGNCRDPWSIVYLAERIMRQWHQPTIKGTPKRLRNGHRKQKGEQW